MNQIAKRAHQPSRFFGFTQLFDLLRSSSIADGVVPASNPGDLVTPRAGHVDTTSDENWYIVGGGDNKNSM